MDSVPSSQIVLEQEFGSVKDDKMSAYRTTDNSVDIWGRPSNKLKTGRWKSASVVCALNVADTMAVIGIGGNLVTYLMFTFHMTGPEAGNLTTNFIGVNYLLPIIWGFLADAYLGRFLTISMACVIAIMGLVMLTVQAATPSQLPPTCTTYPDCPNPSKAVMDRFYGGLFMLAVGSAGIKPCISSLGQEQFDEGDPAEKNQQTHFFTIFFSSIDMGSLISFSMLVWVQDHVGWDKAFGINLGSLALASLAFWLATPFFRHQKPRGSPFTRLAQVFVAAIANSKLNLPPNTSDLHELSDKECQLRGLRKVEHTDGFRWLDRAAIKQSAQAETNAETGAYSDANPWKLCTLTQVEDTKSVIQILPIWLTNITVWTLFAQHLSFSIGQISSVDRRLISNFAIPPASATIFLILAALSVIPLWHYVVTPLTQSRGGVTHLQRMGIGMVLSMVAMVTAALVERKRVGIIRAHGMDYQDLLAGAVPMTVWWFVPQYVILGFTELILGVAHLQFFFMEVPDGMKSVGTALFFGNVAMGYFLSSVLVTVVNTYTNKHGYGWLDGDGILHGGLEKFYWLLTAMVTASIFLFILLARVYRYKQLHSLAAS